MTDYEERAAQIVIVMLALLGMALAIGVLTAPVASAAPRVGDCLPGLIAPVFGVTPLTDPDMAALRSIEAIGTFWRGYDAPRLSDMGLVAAQADDAMGER